MAAVQADPLAKKAKRADCCYPEIDLIDLQCFACLQTKELYTVCKDGHQMCLECHKEAAEKYYRKCP